MTQINVVRLGASKVRSGGAITRTRSITCAGRSIRMTLSLAFLSPVLAEAAMEGRLPRGFDLPMLWFEQWRAVGLQQPIQAQAEPI